LRRRSEFFRNIFLDRFIARQYSAARFRDLKEADPPNSSNDLPQQSASHTSSGLSNSLCSILNRSFRPGKRIFLMNSQRVILCSSVSASSRNRISLLAKIIPILVFVLTSVPRSFAQSCPTVPTGSHTISASVSNSITGIGLAEGAVFPTGGTLRLDAHATTSG